MLKDKWNKAEMRSEKRGLFFVVGIGKLQAQAFLQYEHVSASNEIGLI